MVVHLVKQRSQLGVCDPRAEAEDHPGLGVTLVIRIYTTPAMYGFDQLRQLSDQPGAGSWSRTSRKATRPARAPGP